MSRRCVAVLGGSFDPVHNGHVALADHFSKLIAPDELRVIPTGNPWQKDGLQANDEDRLAMLHLAFAECDFPVVIDTQEIERGGTTYTIDTLQALRNELGAETSLAFLIGADQLQQLHTWKNWQQLFDHANFCVASRPGAALDSAALPLQLAAEIAKRRCSPEQIRSLPHGAICIDEGLAVDISATRIRNAIRDRKPLNTWLPGPVLDYIKQHHLYQR